ncbi:hypothetical protein TrLO_g14574 [Triparma laevis f. longispina]|uniref:C2H2-type domain-containing protein n=1 Tax=Triparma laevis f. longispina TaxID=1714387 RepID=A0A9W7BZT6_9STRA|nr:hypothetical protein TrLO_g14574 [Triparma laevis f. longispina]
MSPIPIAQQIRQASASLPSSNQPPKASLSLDAQIAALEAQLDDSSSPSSSDDEDSVQSPQIISLSAVANETIEPLPASALPTCVSSSIKHKRKSQKKKEMKDKPPSTSSSKPSSNNPSNPPTSGLESTIKSLTYTSRATLSVPFFCRKCNEQMKDLDDFKSHMSSKQHSNRIKFLERSWRCCGIVFNSEPQLLEHQTGKKHKEKSAAGANRKKRKMNDGRQWN